MHVICPYVGGGFGCKGNTWPPATLAAMAAKVVGRPVKLALTRAQMFTSNGYRPRTVQKLRFAADDQGTSGVDAARRLLADVAAGAWRVRRAGRTGDRDAVCLSECRRDASAGGDECGLADVYAGAGSCQRRFRAGIGDRRAGGGAEAWIRSNSGCATTPNRIRIENKPFASKVLRECYRQGADAFGWSRRIARTTLHARRQYADRLGHGDQHLSDASHAGGRACARRSQWDSAGAGGHTGYRHRHLHGDVADRGGRTRHSGRAHPVRTRRQRVSARSGVGRLDDGGERRAGGEGCL